MTESNLAVLVSNHTDSKADVSCTTDAATHEDGQSVFERTRAAAHDRCNACRAQTELPTVSAMKAGEEHTQPQGRVETQMKQLSANECLKQGKDRGASASHESIEARQARCNDPVPRSRSTQSSQQTPLRRCQQLEQRRRERINISSVSGSNCSEGHVLRTEENARSPSQINTQNNVHDLGSETSGSERVLADAAASDQEPVQAGTCATTQATDVVPESTPSLSAVNTQ